MSARQPTDRERLIAEKRSDEASGARAVISSRAFFSRRRSSSSLSFNGAWAIGDRRRRKRHTAGKREMTGRGKWERKRNFHQGKRNSSRSNLDLLQTAGTKNGKRESKKSRWPGVTDNEGVNHVLSLASRRRREGERRRREAEGKRKSACVFPRPY